MFSTLCSRTFIKCFYLLFFCAIFYSLYSSFFSYHSVSGRRESLQRFVVEEGAKPAIFGSYSYDPVKQVFVPPPPDNDTIANGPKIPDQIVNGTYVLSTAVGEIAAVANQTDPVFRKHVTPVTHRNAAWWIRPKLGFKNLTSLHKLNKL